jgi:hypothetical protein
MLWMIALLLLSEALQMVTPLLILMNSGYLPPDALDSKEQSASNNSYLTGNPRHNLDLVRSTQGLTMFGIMPSEPCTYPAELKEKGGMTKQMSFPERPGYRLDRPVPGRPPSSGVGHEPTLTPQVLQCHAKLPQSPLSQGDSDRGHELLESSALVN